MERQSIYRVKNDLPGLFASAFPDSLTGLKMRETGHPSNKLVNCAVRGSLNTAREAYAQLQLLTGGRSSAATLASQIALFDVLLVRISGIRTGFAADIQHVRVTPQASDRNG